MGYGSHNSELFHIWAHQSRDEMPIKGGRNYWFSGHTLYSYSTPIARLMSNGKVLHNVTRYSNTTSGHQYSARVATRHMNAVQGLSAGDYHRDSEEMVNHENLRLFDKKYAAAVKELLIHPKRKITLGREIHNAIEMREAYRAAFELDWPELDQIAVEHEVRAAAAAEREREEWRKQRNKEAAEARKHSQAENLELWRAGKNPGCHFEVTALRLNADRTRIETSRGAQVPVEVAPLLWKLANKCRSTCAEYVPTNTEVKVGFYQLTRIDVDGTLVVGCHTIPFSELELIAGQLGWLHKAAA